LAPHGIGEDRGTRIEVRKAGPPLLRGVSAVRLFVSDFGRAVEFYTGPLGLNVSGGDGRSWVLFRLSNAILLVEPVSETSAEFEELVGRFAGVSFETDDIQQAYGRLSAAGVKFDGPPEKQFWGGWLAHFHDPDDNILTLVG
jgi:lactoylglutathione lyase